jgi:hygromycin-B 7''-O-kinase
VANRWVLKFYGQLFNGAESYAVERLVNQMVSSHAEITREGYLHCPALLASGTSDLPGSNWLWPYLIFDYLPGTSIGEVFDQINPDSKRELAHELGQWVRKLHEIDFSGRIFPRPSYANFLHRQRTNAAARHAEWGSLPSHLIAQIDSYLLPVDQLAQSSGIPHLIHADLTGDHLLGSLVYGRWQSSGVIDFGDAMPGNLFYELGSLYMHLFMGDKDLLHTFLRGYRYPEGLKWAGESSELFSRKAMTTALLHQFNILGGLRNMIPDLDSIQSLEHLSERLWVL